MKLITCIYEGKTRLGVICGARVFIPSEHSQWDSRVDSMLGLIDAGEQAWTLLQSLSKTIDRESTIPFDAVQVLSPIPRPRQNVMCLGWNYVEHLQEATQQPEEEVQLPRSPIVFTKAANSMNGPFSDIPIDLSVSDKMDWEVELGVIIGKGGRGIKKENALQHIFGYTVINDITARDRQKWHKQFFIGKSFSGSCPMGPWIVTSNEIQNPQKLNLRSWVNGVLKQDSNTQYQIFDIATVISILSQGMELELGDIIATGTPSGVGYARKPPEYLMPGDIVECEVENIGKLINKVIAVSPSGFHKKDAM